MTHHPAAYRWTRRAPAAFCVAAACAVTGIAPGAQTTDGYSVAQAPTRIKAFVGARVIDGTDRAPVDNAVIVVRDGRVVSIGPLGRVTIPPEAERITLTGKTVIPGLVNAHGHVGGTEGLQGNHYSAANVARDLRLYADYGVTTVVSLGDDEAAGFAARDAQKTPALNRARLFVAGPVLGPKSPEEARKLVADDQAMKVDIVKIRVDDNLGSTAKMAPEIYQAVIDESHKRGLRVAVHLFYLSDAKAVLDAGADFIAHSVRDTDVDESFIGMIKRRNVCYCPTLTREVSTFVYGTTPDFFSDPLFLKYADAATVTALKDPKRQETMRNSRSAQAYKAGLDVASRNLKKLVDAGVTIAMGTDSGAPSGRFQGYFELMEMEMMARAGLTPKQVLMASTRDAARCQKIDNEVGTLEPNKWADFVALDANPLTDIANVKKIDSVWIAGNRAPR
jgi:imidazolonepropionase-like amidohydrolase